MVDHEVRESRNEPDGRDVGALRRVERGGGVEAAGGGGVGGRGRGRGGGDQI